MSFNHSLTDKQLLLSSVLLCAISSALVYVWRKRYNKRNYVKVAKVCKLVVYPVKAMPGIEVNRLDVTKTGVKYGPFHDRFWRIIDSKQNKISMQTDPKLALLTLSFHGEELWIDGLNMPTLKLKVKNKIQMNDTIIHTKILTQEVDGIDCGPEAGEWISKYLKRPGAKIIHHAQQLAYRKTTLLKDDKLIESAKYPLIYQCDTGVLLLDKISIDELNTKMSNDLKVNYRQFRPNILVTDCEPFAEDNWKYLDVNGVEFTFMKPCDRCLTTTIYEGTGVLNGKQEPLRTMKTYRSQNEKLKTCFGTSPIFGAMFAPETEGQIGCGDIVGAVVKT